VNREPLIIAADSAAYSILEISTGAKKGRVPWGELQRAQVDYIKPKYLPKGIGLKQYYHLKQQDVDAILKHWTRRKASGKTPFRFRDLGKAVQGQNPTAEESDVDPGAGLGKEVECDWLGDYGSQAQGAGAPQGGGSSSGSIEQAQSLRNAAEDPSQVWLLKHGLPGLAGAHAFEIVAFASLSRH
jgi:hypothetical protein